MNEANKPIQDRIYSVSMIDMAVNKIYNHDRK